jgi:hypothetical protein
MKTISNNDIFTYVVALESDNPADTTAAIAAVLTSNGFYFQRQLNPNSAVFKKDCLLVADKEGITVKLVVTVRDNKVAVALQYTKGTARINKAFNYDYKTHRSTLNIWVRLQSDVRQLGIDLNRSAPRGF